MITHSPEETRAAGREFAQQLRPGDIVLLEGPLGSGKTVFAQGVTEGLGAVEPATSPSFVIVNEYLLGGRESGVGSREQTRADSPPTPYAPHPTPAVLRHIDLYRLDDPAVELDRIGLPELLADPAAITIIEWADRLPKDMRQFPTRCFSVSTAHGKNEIERVIEYA